MGKYQVNNAKEEEKSGWRQALYNRQKHTIIGRTAKSWCLIFIFYLIFYGALGGFFYGMMAVFLYGYLDNTRPMRTGEHSLLRSSPGISLFPSRGFESTLIYVSNKSDNKSLTYIQSIDMTGYPKDNTAEGTKNNVVCNVYNDTKSDDDVQKPCVFSQNFLGACQNVSEQLWEGNLCLFLKMNKIHGWIPDLINSTAYPGPLVECRGQNPGDRENLGAVSYSPSHTIGTNAYGKFSHVFFPYINQTGYQTPLVAVRFPNLAKNIVVLVECLLHGLKPAGGSVKFEIMVDA